MTRKTASGLKPMLRSSLPRNGKKAWLPHLDRADRLVAKAYDKESRGLDPRPCFEKALESFGDAIKIAPARINLRTGRAAVNLDFAEAERKHGGDPFPSYREVFRDILEAEKVSGRAPLSLLRAITRVEIARALMEKGEDAGPEIRKGLADLRVALRLQPRNPAVLLTRARIYSVVAKSDFGDEQKALVQSDADFTAIARCRSIESEFLSEWGQILVLLANGIYERGQDPRPTLRRADRVLKRASRYRPKQGNPYAQRGNVWSLWAEAEKRAGRPGDRARDRAAECFKRALALDPTSAAIHFSVATAKRDWANCLSAKERRRLLTEALAHLSAAVGVSPGDGKYLSSRGELFAERAELEDSEPNQTMEDHQQAVRDFDQAIHLEPSTGEARSGRAAVLARMAIRANRIGEDSRVICDRAIEDLDFALRTNPRDGNTWVRRATAYYLRGTSTFAKAPGEIRSDLMKALRDLSQARKLLPIHHGLPHLFFGCLEMLAETEESMGLDSRLVRERTLRELTRLARVHGRDAEFYERRASTLEALGRGPEAKKARLEAIRMAGASRGAF